MGIEVRERIAVDSSVISGGDIKAGWDIDAGGAISGTSAEQGDPALPMFEPVPAVPVL